MDEVTRLHPWNLLNTRFSEQPLRLSLSAGNPFSGVLEFSGHPLVARKLVEVSPLAGGYGREISPPLSIKCSRVLLKPWRFLALVKCIVLVSLLVLSLSVR